MKVRIKQLLEKIKKTFYLKFLKKKYYRTGACLKCGSCCENIYIRHNNSVVKNQDEFNKILEESDYSFYKNVSVVGCDEFGLIFSCNKFDKEKRLCTNHKNRPSICRDYPSEEIFSFGASLKDNCGYKFSPIESFEEVFEKICKNPVKDFVEFVEDDSWEEFSED